MKSGQDPRIARVRSFEWRYCNGHLEWRVPGGKWFPDPHTPEDYAAIAALKNHPTVIREVSAA